MADEAKSTPRVLVIYNTLTGFSKTYGTWIAEDLEADLHPLSEVVEGVKSGRINLASYDLVVYGAGVRMAIIRGFRKFRKMAKDAGILNQGRVIVWANGGTPQHPDRDWKCAARTFTRNELAKGEFPFFYFEGGVRYEGLPAAEKTLLKIFAKRVQKYRDRGEWAVAVADNIAQGYDHTNRDSIAPLVECAREALNHR
ncbi:flavodoxin domain-containing protein [Gleimia europaea]|uniref:flavodoxin domain-containing protein n=1 Tax=Gleimia europaea TaxID=66228 RepID=UPI002657C426|nr:flavodoxin domain-containing protein [Gleimia europaea]MDK7142363.1 flavodoxin domain-containing protein [Gleimia europaea]